MGFEVSSFTYCFGFENINSYILTNTYLPTSTHSLSYSSVNVVIFNKTRKTLVLVKQLRPSAMFVESMNDSSVIGHVEEDYAKMNESLRGM